MGAAAQSQPPSESARAVFAPGNHDGVHLGHQALARTARAFGDAHGLRAIALTFDPHPAAVLAPERAPTPLTTIARRREMLLRAGMHDVWVQPFTREFASLSAEDFLLALIARGAQALVVGPDFRFGQGRAGDVAMLQAFGAKHGLQAIVEPPVLQDGVRVSSSAVREAVAGGAVGRATALLGHVHDVSGRVIVGQQRGRTIGFPTANIQPESVLLPSDGVYAVVVRRLGAPPGAPVLRGVANLGVRPTLGAGRAVEAHLFDFAGDLYAESIRIGFVQRIRPEQKFPDLNALRRQIALDCETARGTLEAADEETWAWI
jgi:riboflavin kinase/FMN adenylyltransferase